MTCVYNYEDYLKRRLAKEDVISIAAVYGYNALQMDVKSSEFIVLELNHDIYSYYRYVKDNDRFYVSEHDDNIPYNINRLIASEMLHNRSMMRWWNCVFFEIDGKRTYDNSYDDLKIADESDRLFKNVLKDLMSVVSNIHLKISNSSVFLTGDLSKNPMLQYVLQKQYESSRFIVLQSAKDSTLLDEKQVVVLPKEKLSKLVLRTNVHIDSSSIVSEAVNITLPLDTSTNSIMVSNTIWKDILFDEHVDYSAQGLNFKNIRLQVDYDSFHNIFMNCQDTRGNCKVIKIN